MYWIIYTCFFLVTFYTVETASSNVDSLIESGKGFLSRGLYNDALNFFDKAANVDSNPIIRFHRSTVYYAQSRLRPALDDLDYVVKNLPSFHQARIQRGNIHLKRGDYQKCLDDASHTSLTSNVKALALKETCEKDLTTFKLCEDLMEEEEFNQVIGYMEGLIKDSPSSTTLRSIRAEARIATRQEAMAIIDLKALVNLVPDNRQVLLKISLMQYRMGEAVESLNSVRDCIKLDQDDKECRKHYNLIKKLTKQLIKIDEMVESNKWAECVEKTIIEMEKNKHHPLVYHAKYMRFICNCHNKGGNAEEAIVTCSEILTLHTQDIESLIDRAESYDAMGDYDKAIEDYNKAKEISPTFTDFDQRIKKVERAKKAASKKDYYKILGVKRNAGIDEINKAYRKLAKEFHPDKFKDPIAKEEAKNKFIDISAAKEVLSDPKLRQQFNDGIDPLDPENKQNGGHGFHPFNGFNPFDSGAGGDFKFNFNF